METNSGQQKLASVNNNPEVVNKRSERARAALERAKGGTATTQPAPQQAVTPVQPAPEIPKEIQTPVTPPASPTGDVVDYDLNPKVDASPTSNASAQSVPSTAPAEPQQPPVQSSEPPLDTADDIDAMIDPKGTTAENFKKLRTKLKALNTEAKEVKTKLEAAESKIKEYESGMVIPEQHQQLLQRISELEVYEKLYNLKGSPAYIETFTKPIQSEMGKLAELAKEYGASDDVIQQALNTDNRAEQNRILSRAFGDEVGVLEARNIINNIRKIHRDAYEAEKQPDAALSALHESSQRIVEERKAKQKAAIATISKDAWVESLIELRQEGTHPELMFREGDAEHNEKYAKPILTQAASEYGRIVKGLAESGLEYLSKDMAKALSRMVKLAHKSALASIENIELRKELAELKKNIQVGHAINRPGMNGLSVPAPSGNGSSGSYNRSTMSAAQRTLAKALGNQK